jgi:tRNA pseudouridine38-40 synthase
MPGSKVNIKVVLEYDGTAFSGFQLQARGRTIEGELKRALRELSGEEVKVVAAGRTDAGAHALGQVVNFRLPGRLGLARLVPALNARLPNDIAALKAEPVWDDFHARRDARWRRYRYRYLDRPARPALERSRCWHLRTRLNVDRMAAAARALVGRHDWTSFCSASEPAQTRFREMRTAGVQRAGEFVELELVAEGFLRGLARGIAGALAEVGMDRRPVAWVGDVLASRDRSRAARTAPAGGLYLVEVIYETDVMKEAT